MHTRLVCLTGSGLLLLWAGACVDLTPVKGRLHTVDAAVGTLDGGAAGSCKSCALSETTQTECTPEIQACEREPGCRDLVECVQRANCYDVHGRDALARCAVPCALGLGVSDPMEPLVQRALDITTCLQRECPGVCY